MASQYPELLHAGGLSPAENLFDLMGQGAPSDPGHEDVWADAMREAERRKGEKKQPEAVDTSGLKEFAGQF